MGGVRRPPFVGQPFCKPLNNRIISGIRWNNGGIEEHIGVHLDKLVNEKYVGSTAILSIKILVLEFHY